jgi:hypothetical protein
MIVAVTVSTLRSNIDPAFDLQGFGLGVGVVPVGALLALASAARL